MTMPSNLDGSLQIDLENLRDLTEKKRIFAAASHRRVDHSTQKPLAPINHDTMQAVLQYTRANVNYVHPAGDDAPTMYTNNYLVELFDKMTTQAGLHSTSTGLLMCRRCGMHIAT
jgi:hypothetical protein